jgi:putative nucleotidyltransferase with HDIG domain
VKQYIRLKGITGEFEGKIYESESLLRAGRLATLDIVLDDNSVSRQHAEVRATEQGWWVRDLKSTNGTFVNAVKLGVNEERQLQEHDVIQFGKVALQVEALRNGGEVGEASADRLRVEATSNASWDDALQSLAYDRNGNVRPGQLLLALVRAGHHLGHLDTEVELLHYILNDAVSVLDAQRGAIVLAEGPDGELKLKALATGRGEPPGRFHFSKNLAQRSFQCGESILFSSVGEDPELAIYQSIAEGAMASVLCVVLRTPRKRLGILHLDRGPWQQPFTESDLHLADALAANVSAGIETAQLISKQRELFYNTITILAQAVELRDPYTGGHTARVTNFAVLLAQQLELSAADIRLVRTGTPLHDIGKIGIDDAILRKPERLTAEEFAIMKSHTTKGAEIVATVPDLVPVIPIVRSHHERWDGQGYPDQLKGEEIPRLARIVAVADAFDAMTSDRPYHPYQKGKPPEEAFAELENQAGKQFDPACVAAFVAIRDQVEEQMRNPQELAVNVIEPSLGFVH